MVIPVVIPVSMCNFYIYQAKLPWCPFGIYWMCGATYMQVFWLSHWHCLHGNSLVAQPHCYARGSEHCSATNFLHWALSIATNFPAFCPRRQNHHYCHEHKDVAAANLPQMFSWYSNGKCSDAHMGQFLQGGENGGFVSLFLFTESLRVAKPYKIKLIFNSFWLIGSCKQEKRLDLPSGNFLES